MHILYNVVIMLHQEARAVEAAAAAAAERGAVHTPGLDTLLAQAEDRLRQLQLSEIT